VLVGDTVGERGKAASAQGAQGARTAGRDR